MSGSDTPGTGERPDGDDAAGEKHSAAVIEVTADAPWLLAPLFLRDFLGLQRVGPGPGLLIDHFPATPSDVQGLMRAVQANRLVQLTAAAADWPIWWTEAVDHRPGPVAPRQVDLLAFSPALTELWEEIAGQFDKWLARRGEPVRSAAVERRILTSVAVRKDRPPAAGKLTVMVIPVVGNLFIRPDDDRIVVTQALRDHAGRYEALLEPVLDDVFLG